MIRNYLHYPAWAKPPPTRRNRRPLAPTNGPAVDLVKDSKTGIKSFGLRVQRIFALASKTIREHVRGRVATATRLSWLIEHPLLRCGLRTAVPVGVSPDAQRVGTLSDFAELPGSINPCASLWRSGDCHGR